MPLVSHTYFTILLFKVLFYTAGEDYHEPLSLELILDSTTSAQINIPIINDDIFELTESFLVNLSLIGGSTSQNSTGVLILDDDGTACECQIHNVQFNKQFYYRACIWIQTFKV